MPKTLDLKQKLLDNISQAPNGCWIWERCYGSHGYGQITFQTKSMTTHTASYKVHKGDVPTGMFVLHNCGNRGCINPEHLYLGTAKQNSADLIATGHDFDTMSKLSDEDARAIYDLAINKLFPQYLIAEMYGVTQPTVSRIKHRHNYWWV